MQHFYPFSYLFYKANTHHLDDVLIEHMITGVSYRCRLVHNGHFKKEMI